MGIDLELSRFDNSWKFKQILLLFFEHQVDKGNVNKSDKGQVESTPHKEKPLERNERDNVSRDISMED